METFVLSDLYPFHPDNKLRSRALDTLRSLLRFAGKPVFCKSKVTRNSIAPYRSDRFQISCQGGNELPDK